MYEVYRSDVCVRISEKSGSSVQYYPLHEAMCRIRLTVKMCAKLWKRITDVGSFCSIYVDDVGVKHLTKADLSVRCFETLQTQIGSNALMYLDATIPVYALIKKGKRLVLAYSIESKDEILASGNCRSLYLAKNWNPRFKGYTHNQKA